jgi:hypothetical protein
MRALAVPAAVGLAVAISGIAVSTAVAAPSGICGPAHRYIDVQSATEGPLNVVIVDGRGATLKCGGEDDSSYVPGKKLSLTLAKTATVTFWKVPENPDGGTRTLRGAAALSWFKRNRSEPVYKITGPNNAVTKLVEKWHP